MSKATAPQAVQVDARYEPGSHVAEPSGAGNGAALLREGMQLLRDGKHRRAVACFSQVVQQFPNTEAARIARLQIADAYFAAKSYPEALRAYEEIENTCGLRPEAAHAAFRQGMCHFHLRPATADRDQSHTQKAAEHLQRFRQTYPQDKNVGEADRMIAVCREELAEREWYVGNFNFANTTCPEMARYRGALARYRTLIERYPESRLRSQAEARAAECEQLIQRLTDSPPRRHGLGRKILSIFDARW